VIGGFGTTQADAYNRLLNDTPHEVAERLASYAGIPLSELEGER
jgi:hypothetical protein